MKKVAIIGDGTGCLPVELVEQYSIHSVPLLIVHRGKTYRDGIDITPSEIYEIMRRREDLPTTSTPSVGDFLNAFHSLSEEAESVFCVTLTSLQSKVHDIALMAKEAAKEAIPDTPIEVLDSRAVAGALGFITLAAARTASQGGELSQVIDAARGVMRRVTFLTMMDTLYYLARTGRVGRTTAWTGSLLGVKPIVEHRPTIGEPTPVARPRTKERAIRKMLEIMEVRVGAAPVHVIVNHADEPEDAEKLKAEIEARFRCTELHVADLTPAMGVHAGPGVLGAAFHTD